MEKRQLPEDFLDFLDLLNSNNVKYLQLGGWAVGIYGHPRATKDIDFLINTDDENLIKLSKALYEFIIFAWHKKPFKKPLWHKKPLFYKNHLD